MPPPRAVLLDAWREVQENDLEDSKVSLQVAAYSNGILEWLAALSRALREGTWEPSLVYAMEIEQRSGGKRLLAVPAVEDRIRLYPLPATTLNELIILGNRRLEERADFWIV